jgi:spore coat protein CotF
MAKSTERTPESEQEVKEYQNTKKWYEPKTISERQDLDNCVKEKKNG